MQSHDTSDSQPSEPDLRAKDAQMDDFEITENAALLSGAFGSRTALTEGECTATIASRNARDGGAATGKNQVGFNFLRTVEIGVILLAIAATSGQLWGQALPDLITVRNIRALTPDEAQQGRPVRLRGVVTVFSGWKSSFFFQDETAGISVSRTNDSPEVQQGQLVELRGSTSPGMFAPVVVADRVTVLGNGKMPPARLFGVDELAGGKQDAQWIAIRGIVRSAVVEHIWERSVLVLEVDIGGGNLVTVRVHAFSEADWGRLPGSSVSVRGVCGTVFNDKRQFIGLRLYVQNLADVRVEHPATADPFDIPTRALGSLLQFGDQEGGAISRVKVRGIVTYSRPHQGLYIQDGEQGIFVQSTQATRAALGSQVEAVGYPAAGRYSPKLDDAVFRVVGTAAPLVGLPQVGSAMIVYNDGSSAAPYDSVLVQLKGRLVEEVSGVDEDLLFLREGKAVITARMPRSGQNHRSLVPGSLLSITGICVANADETHEARSFDILLRSAADVVVLEQAPWWTASHAAWLVGILVIVVLWMSGWLVLVQRQAQLRVLTVTDPLTGLYNRRGFVLLTEHQWQLAQRKKSAVLLFYIDVDKFKEINDSFGHKEGDVALQAVAALLRHCFRKTDIIGRLGGDEFAVAALEAPAHTQPVLEQRLARALQEHNQRPHRTFKLSLSIGIVSCDGSLASLSIEGLLAQADTRMYQQKREAKTPSLGSDSVSLA
jgi:diguanylate cyclase (GGDEF)-like protein